MEEVKVVLAKHDIAGVVLLASQTHTEYLYEFSTSWSCAKIEGDQLHIKAKREHFPSKEAHVKCVTETVGMLAGFGDVMAQALDAMTRVLRALGQQFEIAHQSRHEPPHPTQ